LLVIIGGILINLLLVTIYLLNSTQNIICQSE